MAQYLSQTRLEEPIWLEPGDVTFLRTRISETETQASELRRAYDAQLHALRSSFEAQISELTRQKDTKLVEIASYRNIYSSVRRVPQEILSKNLELYCLPETVSGIPDRISSGKPLPFLACVAWTAHTTPRLWSTLCLSWLKHHNVFERDVAWVNSGLTGVKVFLWTCILNFPSMTSFAVAQPNFSNLSYAFVIKSDCWTFAGGFHFKYLPLFHLRDSSLSLLEEVRFSLYESLQDEYTFADLLLHFPHGIDTLLGAPKLRCVRIEESNEVSILRALVLPAEQLTSLDIDSASHDIERYVYLDMLPRRCGNLVNLKVLYDLEIGPVTFPCSDSAIFLSALQSLHIFCHEVPRKNLLCCLLSPCKAH
ncbi:hypothetical protein BT96DRAFT_994501 [Gymnopus androsaceus JB14]|uniref:F-box domain-containing protein n=1 Tax=Gymnopus androsaceus JB14 TaxID=1447944 RepID=A0A6A4HP54_9AGAR|nr:hypothetical protein BT96DRAFT_994501 [Gymnopus androsaceus JB14]